MSEHKICRRCGVDKALSEYYKDKTHADGHKNICKECIAVYDRERYRENREEIKQCKKNYYRENKERIKQCKKNYYRENKERINKRNCERAKRRLKTDPIFKLKHQVRNLIWGSFNRRGYVKSARAEAILGCKMEDFMAYLKQTWFDKYHTEWVGQPCEIDHIVPLAIAKTEEEVIKLCHYTNLRLLTPEDNLEKSDKIEGEL